MIATFGCIFTAGHCEEFEVTVVPPPVGSKFSAYEAASYSKDLIEALKGIAERQQHYRLAELLGAAAAEATRLAALPERDSSK